MTEQPWLAANGEGAEVLTEQLWEAATIIGGVAALIACYIAFSVARKQYKRLTRGSHIGKPRLRYRSGPDTHLPYAVRSADRAGNTFWQPRTTGGERAYRNLFTRKRFWGNPEDGNIITEGPYATSRPELYSSHRRATRIGKRHEAETVYQSTRPITETPGA